MSLEFYGFYQDITLCNDIGVLWFYQDMTSMTMLEFYGLIKI